MNALTKTRQLAAATLAAASLATGAVVIHLQDAATSSTTVAGSTTNTGSTNSTGTTSSTGTTTTSTTDTSATGFGTVPAVAGTSGSAQTTTAGS